MRPRASRPSCSRGMGANAPLPVFARLPRSRTVRSPSSSSTTDPATGARTPSPPSTPTFSSSGSPRTCGFAGGMNAGSRAAFAAGAEAVVLLNNDMEVEPDFVGPLVEGPAADPAAAARARQIFFTGQPPRIWYAGASFSSRMATAAVTWATAGRRYPATVRRTRPVGPAAGRCCSRPEAAGAGRPVRRGAVRLRRGHGLVAARASSRAAPDRRSRQHRPPCRVRLVGRRVVPRDDLLRIAQHARRRRALGTAGVRWDARAAPRGSCRLRGSGACLAAPGGRSPRRARRLARCPSRPARTA